jgi:hypothetical protein
MPPSRNIPAMIAAAEAEIERLMFDIARNRELISAAKEILSRLRADMEEKAQGATRTQLILLKKSS